MQLWRDLPEVPGDLPGTVVTLGNFDGVHRGHQAVLSRVTATAHGAQLPSVVITFDPHPVAVLRPEHAPALLTSLPQRLDLLEVSGVDAVLLISFTREFAAMPPQDFVRTVLVDRLHARHVVVGADTRFGARNAGDVRTLRALGAELGFTVEAVPDVGGEGRWSSTLVRRHLVAGDPARAAELLGRPHVVAGIVVHGDHRGRDLGFPTANLSPHPEGLVPADGVYAGWLVRIDRPQDDIDYRLPAAISVGTNPTFDGAERRVEAYVLDRSDLDLYDEQVAIEFVALLRPTVKFASVDELIDQMHDDVHAARGILRVPGSR